MRVVMQGRMPDTKRAEARFEYEEPGFIEPGELFVSSRRTVYVRLGNKWDILNTPWQALEFASTRLEQEDLTRLAELFDLGDRWE